MMAGLAVGRGPGSFQLGIVGGLWGEGGFLGKRYYSVNQGKKESVKSLPTGVGWRGRSQWNRGGQPKGRGCQGRLQWEMGAGGGMGEHRGGVRKLCWPESQAEHR